jgi:RNase P/RNase MRP subunit p30/RNase P/RNase MRP subunit POP5
MIEKAVELGYRILGITFPANSAKEEIQAVGGLCSKLGVNLVTRVDLAPKTVGELIKDLRVLRRRAEVVAVSCFSKAVARQAAKDRRVDLLSFPSPSPRNHFFDRAEAELASGALAALEIEMAPLLRLQGFRRCLLLSTLRRELLVAEKTGVPVILSSGADEPYLLRHFEDYASLSYLFGMDLHAAKKAKPKFYCAWDSYCQGGKELPKSVRRRYVAVRTEGEQAFTEKELYDAVWSSLIRLFGEFGVSHAELVLIEYNPKSRQAVFRCSHKTLELVKAAIVALTEIGSEKAALHILRVSGTLKALRRKLSKPK